MINKRKNCMKMKKVIAIVMAAGMVVSLAGCGNSASEQGEAESFALAAEGSAKAEEADPFADFEMSRQDMTAISNCMNYSKAAFSKSLIYGLSLNAKGQSQLASEKADGSGLTVLSHFSASNVNVEDQWIYYVATDPDTGKDSINKIRTSGQDETRLIELEDNQINTTINHMFLADGSIYYTVNTEPEDAAVSGTLCRADLDGNNEEVLLEKACYYPYLLNGYMYYQDDADGCSLHRYRLVTGEDEQVISQPVYQYFSDGEHLYYYTYEEEVTFDENNEIENADDLKKVIRICDLNGDHMQTLDLNANVIQMAFDGDRLYYIDQDDQYRLYSYDLQTEETELVAQETDLAYVTFLGSHSLVYYDFSEDYGAIDHIYMLDLEDNEKLEIFNDR